MYKTKQLQYNIEIYMNDASHICLIINLKDHFIMKWKNLFFGVKQNHSLLMQGGMLDTCELDFIKIHWKCNFE
jgi:hypothetical protein